MSEESKFTIIRDTREKDGHGWNFRASKYCDGQELQALKTGDYSIAGFEDKFCIERKGSVAEVAKNISEDRFWREVERMEAMPYRFIIFEFPMSDIVNFPNVSAIPRNRRKYIKISGNYLLSKILDLQIKHNIVCIFLDDKYHSQRVALAIIKKVHQLVN